MIATRGQPPTHPDDPAEVARFESAYRDCGRAVLGYALRRAASREDALDAVAETFATAWRRRADMPDHPDEVRPWLFAVARRCLANAARSATRAGRLGSALAAAMPGDAVPDPALLHEHRAEHRAVLDALGELPDHDRELVTLVAWEGLTPTQAAAVLDLAPGTARVRLHRARTRLRAALGTPPGTPPGTSAHQEDLR